MPSAKTDKSATREPSSDVTISSPCQRLPPQILTVPLPPSKWAARLSSADSSASERRQCITILIATILCWIGIAVYYAYGPSMPYGGPAHSILVFLVFCGSCPVVVLPFLLFEQVRKQPLSPFMIGLVSYPTMGAFFGPFLALLTLPPLLFTIFARRIFPNDKAIVIPALFLGAALDIIGIIVIPFLFK